MGGVGTRGPSKWSLFERERERIGGELMENEVRATEDSRKGMLWRANSWNRPLGGRKESPLVGSSRVGAGGAIATLEWRECRP